MILTKKIKAFTLSELLVVLIISSIVVSLTIVLLLMVQKQVKSIQTNLDKKQEIDFLERILWQDFSAYTVTYQKEKDLFFLISSMDSIKYQFEEDYILRKKDTIAIQIANKKLFLDGDEVTSGVIDGLQLETSTNFGNRKLFVYKHKSAAHYLNN